MGTACVARAHNDNKVKFLSPEGNVHTFHSIEAALQICHGVYTAQRMPDVLCGTKSVQDGGDIPACECNLTQNRQQSGLNQGSSCKEYTGHTPTHFWGLLRSHKLEGRTWTLCFFLSEAWFCISITERSSSLRDTDPACSHEPFGKRERLSQMPLKVSKYGEASPSRTGADSIG